MIDRHVPSSKTAVLVFVPIGVTRATDLEFVKVMVKALPTSVLMDVETVSLLGEL